MSWFPERGQRSWFRRFCTRVLKTGPIPKHVAIIMDGNRRFAVKNSMDRAEGHLKGFDKLAETLEWCLDLGITEVTVYAFSIENFKRCKEEVDCLMELARKKFAKLMEEKDALDKHGVCIRILGNIALLPKDIQEIVADVVTLTQHNNRATLNVCFSYTSRDEICTAMREIAAGVDSGLLRNSDVCEDLLEKCLYTAPSEDPDLLIRTSGEVRLSDFLLWQSSFSVLAFVQVLWPDFTLWHLYAAILHYQRNYDHVQNAKANNQAEKQRLERESDRSGVLEEMGIVAENTESVGCVSDSINMQARVQNYAQLREQRTTTFLQQLRSRRCQYLEGLLSHRHMNTVAVPS